MKFFSSGTSVVILSVAARDVVAHSWVEQMLVIKNGTYFGSPGYMRGYNPRGPGFSDPMNDYLLPPLPSGRLRINGSDSMCKPTQQTSNYTDQYPKLNAAPGDFVALRYLENGHVTLPNNQIGKPGSGGTVMVFATQEPKTDEKLMDVLKWNTDGTGGDRRGRLLSVQNFDDGRCYQINTSPISIERQQKYPNRPSNAPPGTANEEMWCETDIRLPKDTNADSDLTLYWAWQWNTLPNRDPGIPNGKDEWYTSCIDIAIRGPGQVRIAGKVPPAKLLVQDPQRRANPDFIKRSRNVTLPDGGPDGGDGTYGNAAAISSPSSTQEGLPFSSSASSLTSVTQSPPAHLATSSVVRPPGFIGAEGASSAVQHLYMTLTRTFTIEYSVPHQRKRAVQTQVL